MQEGTSPPKWTKCTTQKVYVGHLHHYSKSVPMVWDPKTKLVSPQFHVMLDDNFDTIKAPTPNIKQADTMDLLFKTNIYTYIDTFGNEHTYLFSHGGADIHPYNLTPTIETCQSSFTMTPCSEIDDLMDINNFECIPKTDLPPRTRYLDLIWTYRRKHHPEGSLKKYKARLCVNGSRQIQGIDYTESFAPVVQWSTIRMVNTLDAMHNLKGKQIDFTQAFPQAKLKEDIYLRFPAGVEHKNEKLALKLK
jgi:hypothetical protein